ASVKVVIIAEILLYLCYYQFHDSNNYSLLKTLRYGYFRSQENTIIAHSNFKGKRRWNKNETNFGENNNVIGYLKPD
ncbi:MAG: hypothetical protein RSF40_11570, partial [Oscillospiraceae bacterium]